MSRVVSPDEVCRVLEQARYCLMDVSWGTTEDFDYARGEVEDLLLRIKPNKYAYILREREEEAEWQ